MSRIALALVLAVTGLSAVIGAPAPSASAAPAATRSVVVTGAGTSMYPAFDPSIERYGITTTAATGGRVRVDATTSDPDGTVLVNGAPAEAPVSLEGLEEGEEISVIFDDADGRQVHSLVYLPSRFPRLDVTHDALGSAPGVVGVTLSEGNAGTDHFETALDRNGVPVYVRRLARNSMDFKRQLDGTLTSSRPATSAGREGHALHALDEQLRTTSVHETVGLRNTDGHDSIRLPNGHLVLLSYEFDEATRLTDSVIQELDDDGDVVFEWNSADHIDPDTETVLRLGANGDYAHINSVQKMADGHFLASFRHTSSVMKIARFADQGFAPGEVMWRLGGKLSDIEFVDDPYPGGPCAQHTAYETGTGTIVIFDNGSWRAFGDNPLCVDPEDRTGPSVERPFSRVTEYAVDAAAGTATLEWSYEQVMDDADGNPTRMGAIFAGSAIRLANGNTLVNWAPDRRAVATEVTPEGNIAWQVSDTHPTISERFFSYRAFRFELPDAIDPEVHVPGGSAVYVQGEPAAARHTCTDRGGSSLRSCVSSAPGGMLDTATVGRHTVAVTATDGNGNTATGSYAYTVEAAPRGRPDGFVRAGGSGWVGKGVHGPWREQRVVVKLPAGKRPQVARVRLRNDGNVTDRFAVTGSARSRAFAVRYLHAGRDVTRKVVAGTLRTPALTPGSSVTVKVRVTRTPSARRGARHRMVVRAGSVFDGTTDRVAVVARARR
jgi:hypothetical protein